ncbi:hypothetical protein DL769_007073 [Monosporascus sp. CRB-8-3]|nr:hypothetical protein DL769_007073 [Monosporascus sp. CRB-8-3]
MGRPRKYHSQEERLAAARNYTRQSRLRRQRNQDAAPSAAADVSSFPAEPTLSSTYDTVLQSQPRRRQGQSSSQSIPSTSQLLSSGISASQNTGHTNDTSQSQPFRIPFRIKFYQPHPPNASNHTTDPALGLVVDDATSSLLPRAPAPLPVTTALPSRSLIPPPFPPPRPILAGHAELRHLHNQTYGISEGEGSGGGRKGNAASLPPPPPPLPTQERQLDEPDTLGWERELETQFSTLDILDRLVRSVSATAEQGGDVLSADREDNSSVVATDNDSDDTSSYFSIAATSSNLAPSPPITPSAAASSPAVSSPATPAQAAAPAISQPVVTEPAAAAVPAVPAIPVVPATAQPAPPTAAAVITPAPDPLHVYLIKAWKTLPGCPRSAHRQLQTADAHCQRHADRRTSVRCHSLRDVTLALQGRPLSEQQGAYRPPPLPAGRYDTFHSTILQLRRDAVALDDDDVEEDDLDPPVSSPSGPPLPSVLDSGRIGLRAYPELLNCRQAFEGSGEGGVPPRLCPEMYYDQTSDNARPFLVSYDVDSICGFASSLAVARQGIRWFPAMNTAMNITANIHLGIPVPPPPGDADRRWQPAPLHLIPHYAFGQVGGWDSMLFFIVFPRLYKHPVNHERDAAASAAPQEPPRAGYREGQEIEDGAAAENADADLPGVATDEDDAYADRHRTRPTRSSKRGTETLLSSDQISLWTDAVLLPAIHEAVAVAGDGDAVMHDEDRGETPDSNVLQHLPSSYAAAVHLTNAPREAVATGRQGEPRKQNVAFVLNARHLGRLTPILRRRVRESPEYTMFRDFVLFFASKNTKLEFMRSGTAQNSGFPECIDKFVGQWRRQFDPVYYDTKTVWVDIGKQVTARDTTLPYTENLPAGFRAETFLWRDCCLQHIVESRKQWLQARGEEARRAAAADSEGDSDESEGEQGGRGGGDSPPASDEDGDGVTTGRRQLRGYAFPVVTWYPWAMVDGVSSVTIASAPGGHEIKEGLVYSQLYNLIKGPFDAQKHYVFRQPFYENLALDPLYQRQLRQDGRATVINQAVAQNAYVQSKKRIALNLAELPLSSRGVRSEDRITLELLLKIRRDWDNVDAGTEDAVKAQALVEARQPPSDGTVRAAAPRPRTVPSRRTRATGAGLPSPTEDDGVIAFPWYSVPTSDIAHFLTAQLNRHCLLFEYIHSQADIMYSLAESVPMVIALRSLAYCYSSNLLYSEPLLYKGDWTQFEWVPGSRDGSGDDAVVIMEDVGPPPPPPTRGRGRGRGRPRGRARGAGGGRGRGTAAAGEERQRSPSGGARGGLRGRGRGRAGRIRTRRALDGGGDGGGGGEMRPVKRMGLGIGDSMRQHGFGWWRPGIFRWEYWRFTDEVCSKLLVGNILLHQQYQRQWRAVRQIRDSMVYMLQASQWFSRFQLGLAENEAAAGVWLEYLHCLVIRQFDFDVWQKLHEENRRYPELRDAAAAAFPPGSPPVFCYDTIKELFYDRGAPNVKGPLPPHLVSGNRMQAKTTPLSLIRYLFGWDDGKQRSGWGATKYRVLAQRAYRLITQFFCRRVADEWLADLCRVVLLTHWILPYPAATGLFSTTKAVAHENKQRRTMWFSIMLYQRSETLSQVKEHHVVSWKLEGTHVMDITGRQQYANGEPQPVLFCQRLLASAFEQMFPGGEGSGTIIRSGYDIIYNFEDARDRDDKSRLEDRMMVGRIPSGSGNGKWIPVVERGTPPQLRYGKVMVGKTIDELDVWFEREISGL